MQPFAESPYAVLFDRSPDPLLALDRDTAALRAANAAARQLFGLPPDAGEARDDRGQSDERWAELRSRAESAARAGRRRFAARVPSGDGEEWIFEVTCHAVDLPDHPVWLLALRPDGDVWADAPTDESPSRATAPLAAANERLRQEIEERLRFEEELTEVNGRFEDLAANVPGLIFQTRGRLDGTTFGVPYVGGRVQEFLGWTPEEIYAQPDRMLDAIHPDDQPLYFEKSLAACRDLSPFEIEFRTVSHRTGEVRWLRVSSRGRFLGDGEGMYNGLAVDITELKQAEAALRASHDELEHRVAERTAEREALRRRTMVLQQQLADASRLSLMGEMASGFAHEVHQPLAVIANYANGSVRRLERGTVPPAELADRLRDVAAEAVRAGDIVRRIRSFIQRREVRREWQALGEVLHSALALAEFHSRHDQVRVELHNGAALPAVFIDRIQITQVVLNLVLNALDAVAPLAPDRRRVVLASQLCGDEGVEVSCRDGGPGIAPDVREQLFRQFFTTKPDGLGMGLAISRSLIETHGGRLWLHATSDEGTEFRFTLPVQGSA